jgi:hypothetical protein
MNAALVNWYGTADMEKMSAAGGVSIDDSDVLVIRALWEASGRSKESMAGAVQQHQRLADHLGGQEHALSKLSQAVEWLEVWDRAEAKGIAAARSALLSEMS